jgi:hypothetical protein
VLVLVQDVSFPSASSGGIFWGLDVIETISPAKLIFLLAAVELIS